MVSPGQLSRLPGRPWLLLCQGQKGLCHLELSGRGSMMRTLLTLPPLHQPHKGGLRDGTAGVAGNKNFEKRWIRNKPHLVFACSGQGPKFPRPWGNSVPRRNFAKSRLLCACPEAGQLHKATMTPATWHVQWYVPFEAPRPPSVRTGSDSWLSSTVCYQLTGKRKPHSFAECNSHISSAVQAPTPDRGEWPPQLSSQKAWWPESTKAPGNSTCGLSPAKNKTGQTQMFLVTIFFWDREY